MKAPGELRELGRLAFPIAITQFALMALSLVDTAIVGKSSPIDLAGVSLARSVLFALSAFGIGIAIVLEPLASQALGSKEPDRAWGAFRNTLRAASLIAVPTFLVSYGVVAVMPSFGVDARVVRSALRFLVGNCLTTYFFVAFSVSKTFLQAHGKTTPALVAVLLANVFNYFACLVLVRGDAALAPLASVVGHEVKLGLPALGSLGAGIAGSISTLLMFFALEFFTRRERALGPNLAPAPLAIVKLALPLGAQVLAEIGVFSVAGFLCARLGPSVLAAHQVALGLASFTFMGGLGLAGATSVLVGRAVGEGRSPRKEGLIGIVAGGVFMLLGTSIFVFFPDVLVSFFTDDPEVSKVAISLVRLAAIFQFFDGIQVVSAGALRGAGDFRYPFLANVGAHWAVGFPMAFVLGIVFKQGAPGIWWGLTMGLVCVAGLLAWRFERLSRGIIVRLEDQTPT